MKLTSIYPCPWLFLGAMVLMPCAHAQAPADGRFPNRPLRMIVSQAAGGPTDVVARIYATRLTELLGQQVVVDNRYSAGGAIAGEILSKAPADGHTLMVAANGTLAVAPHLVRLKFDARKDFTPVALIGDSPLGLLVNLSLPANSTRELVDLAKARPGKINFGSSGQGATSHLAGEMLKMLTGINIVHVPYKGASPATIAVISGEIEMLITGLSASMPYVRQKQLKLLAVSSAKRVSMLPDLPSMGEAVPGYDVSSWYMVMVPAATPKAIINKLNQTSNRALTTPEVQARLQAAGVELNPLSPQELYTKLSADIVRWGKVVKAAGIKAN